jgi:hypothetical protein
MKATVRDDIISLNSFVSAEFKYKKYLEILMKAGNYCFLDQFKKLIPGGQSIIKSIIENNLVSTENINKNYKYIYLTDTAMKYLYLKNSDKDYSEIEKNRISVTKVNKYPSEKQLLSSAYKFHLLAIGEELIDRDSIINGLEDYIYLNELKTTREKYNEWFDKNNDGLKKRREKLLKSSKEINEFKEIICSINKEIFDTKIEINEVNELKKTRQDIQLEIQKKITEKRLFKTGTQELDLQLKNINIVINEIEKRLLIKNITIKNYNNYFSEKENYNKNVESKLNNFETQFNKVVKNTKEFTIPKFEKSKKIFENIYNISKIIARIKDNTLEFIILDLGTLKPSWGYFRLINGINELKLGYETIKVIIYSYAEHKSLNLNKEFLAAAKKKINASDTLKSYNSKINEYDTGQRPLFYINANKIYDSIPDFEIEIRPDFYYMQSYKEFVTSGTKSIKRRDKKAIDELITKLK